MGAANPPAGLPDHAAVRAGGRPVYLAIRYVVGIVPLLIARGGRASHGKLGNANGVGETGKSPARNQAARDSWPRWMRRRLRRLTRRGRLRLQPRWATVYASLVGAAFRQPRRQSPLRSNAAAPRGTSSHPRFGDGAAATTGRCQSSRPKKFATAGSEKDSSRGATP